NAFNQLSSFNNNGTLTHYDYDPLGRRIAKHTEHGKIDYIWDNDQLIGEYQHGEYTWYINLPNQFHPVALIKQGEVYYYHLDQLNTPRFVTNINAEVVWQNHADVYGYEEPEADTDFNKENTFTQPIRFQGQYFDEESGLHYNRYRYYSPKQQRFINQDPIGLVGGINHYQYAPNPVNWVDPFGLMCKEGEASLKEALHNCTQSGIISPELSDKLYLAAQDGNLTPKEIKHGLAALAVAKAAPVQSLVNSTATTATRIAVQTAANDALYVAERAMLAKVAPWLARALGTVSLLAYSPSTGGALEELAGPDGTIYSKHSDEVYYKAVGVDGDEWSTDDVQEDIGYRTWLANGGDGSISEWRGLGKPQDLDERNSGIRLIDIDNLSAKDVPTYKSGEFNAWFDSLSPEELALLYKKDKKIRRKIENGLRGDGGMHEHLMVSKAPHWKKWGVTVEQVHNDYSVPTEKLKWTIPGSSTQGGHRILNPETNEVTAPGSSIFHKQLGEAIDQSSSLEQFDEKLNDLKDKWKIIVEK
ncbi:RHS repeat domain-containing protein, partial [Pseudoalteromonas sp. 68 DY56-GL68]|uniref:RHS repeat domain-containing protein n=1 Tax=Pseudoalteromonas sp. 68 DY56-GL68 TaxID=2974919 RepID=UPI00352A9AF9